MQMLDGLHSRRLLTVLVATALATAAIFAGHVAEHDDCVGPDVALGAIVYQGPLARALLIDSRDHGQIVKPGDQVGDSRAVVLHIDADSVTLTPDGDCLVRYR